MWYCCVAFSPYTRNWRCVFAVLFLACGVDSFLVVTVGLSDEESSCQGSALLCNSLEKLEKPLHQG